MILIYLIGVGFTILYSILDGYHDYNVIRWKNTSSSIYRKRWHLMDAIIKGYVFFVISSILFLIGYHTGTEISWLVIGNIIRLAIIMAITRWIIFDMSINYFLHGWNGLFEKGTTSMMDKRFNSKWIYLVAKFIIMAFACATFGMF